MLFSTGDVLIIRDQPQFGLMPLSQFYTSSFPRVPFYFTSLNLKTVHIADPCVESRDIRSSADCGAVSGPDYEMKSSGCNPTSFIPKANNCPGELNLQS